MKVLMIDDDIGLGETMKPVLQMFAISLDVAHSSEEGLEQIKLHQYDLVLLDVMLPRITGLEICRTIRNLTPPLCDIPIIMVSARTDLVDRVVGLETGADDYVAKPFEPRELIARINAVCRRHNDFKPKSVVTEKKSSKFIMFQMNDDTLRIDVSRAQVFINDNLLDITSMEFEILLALSKTPSDVLSQEELLQRCNGNSVIYSRSIIALIYRLRNKIREAGARVDFIRTIRSRGYAIVGFVDEV
ncbi:response regulator transcription factor [Neisseria sp. Ec49-e6-T10]|uniref:response regulator transcription factor n=1 Tax=Neisseria sp. Ec49-e6-T10 TaxID=3140744 RepID=UPI003EC0B13B